MSYPRNRKNYMTVQVGSKSVIFDLSLHKFVRLHLEPALDALSLCSDVISSIKIQCLFLRSINHDNTSGAWQDYDPSRKMNDVYHYRGTSLIQKHPPHRTTIGP